MTFKEPQSPYFEGYDEGMKYYSAELEKAYEKIGMLEAEIKKLSGAILKKTKQQQSDYHETEVGVYTVSGTLIEDDYEGDVSEPGLSRRLPAYVDDLCITVDGYDITDDLTESTIEWLEETLLQEVYNGVVE